MPVPAPLGPPERGQMLLAFGGGYRPRQGPKPVAKTFTTMPAGAVLRGGLQAATILRSFARSKADKAQKPQDEDEVQGRRAFTRELKLGAIQYSELYMPQDGRKAGQPISIYLAAQDLGISTKMLREWKANKDGILHQRKMSCRNVVPDSYKGKEDEMERRLMVVYRETRDEGDAISHGWFERHAQEIYKELYPERCRQTRPGEWEYDGFRFSNGWFAGFRERFNLSDRASTKQAQQAPDEIRPILEKWLQFNRRQTVIRSDSIMGPILSHDTLGTKCVGRFKLSEIANMDQTPLSYEFLDKRTYEVKGSKTIWVKETRSGWDRRQATLQICVFADGIPRCRPQLIFKGKEKGQRRRDVERRSYHPGVDVLFNDKSWANEKTMLHWLKTSYRSASAYPVEAGEPRLLVLDAFRAHLTPDLRAEMAKLKVSGSYIPGGCTGYVQPLDVAMNQPLKALIKKAAERHQHIYKVEYATGKYRKVENRRILLTHLVAEAWDEFHNQYKDTIVDTFRRVGLSLNPDGSEDSEIHIKGLEGMEVGDWILPEAENLTQEEEAAAAAPNAIMEREERSQKKKEARKRVGKKPVPMPNASEDEVDEEDEGEESSEISEVDSDEFLDIDDIMAGAHVSTPIIPRQKHSWEWDEGPERGFQPIILSSKRRRGDAAVTGELE